MKHPCTPAFAAFLTALAASPAPVVAQDPPVRPAALAAAELMVPIHSHPDDPVFGPYGTWAVGPDYKASFDDGFAFYPQLGAAYPENLPMRWYTERVSAGGDVLVQAGDQPDRHYTDWRYEYRYRGLVEAYDVRKDGVEQTFTLPQRPAHSGDWIVTGRLETRLRADTQPDRHGALEFRDRDGHPLVQYGAAFAVDAGGDWQPVTTHFDGDRIRLTVDGRWLDSARYPVVLDPLMSRVNLDLTALTAPASDIEIGYERESSVNNTMVVFARTFAGNDVDVFAVMLTSPGFRAPFYTVFGDVSASLQSRRPTVAFVAGADRWVIAFQRQASIFSNVRLWLHDKANGNPSGGSMLYLSTPTGFAHTMEPDVGGAEGGGVIRSALVVYQSEPASGTISEVWGVIVDASTKSQGTPFPLANITAAVEDREHPAVNQVSNGINSPWAVAWQHTNGFGFSEIRAQLFTPQGARAITETRISSVTTPISAVRPAIAGRSGRYMCSYVRRSSGTGAGGTALEVARFDVPSGGQVTGLRHNTVATTGSGSLSGTALAYDPNTQSHWTLVYEQSSLFSSSARVARLGFSGGVVESAGLATTSPPPGVHDPAVTMNPDSGEFLLVYTDRSGSLGYPVVGTTLQYAPDAINSAYGSGCGGSISGTAPYAGSQFFEVRLNGARPVVPVVLFLSSAPASLSLDPIKMFGCTLLVDTRSMIALPASTSGAGRGDIQIKLPDNPLVIGDLYSQWIHYAPGANPADLLASPGLLSQVR